MEALFTDSQIAESSIEIPVSGLTGITCDGLSNGEFIVIEVQKLDGDFQPLSCGTTMLLAALTNTQALTAPGIYRLSKPITKNAVSAGYTTA